jgi:hypothetical protein
MIQECGMRTAIAVAGLQFVVVIVPPLDWPLDFLGATP